MLGPTNGRIMYRAHTEVFQQDGSWKPNDWFAVPAGLKRMTVNGITDWFPSWYNKEKSTAGEKIVFDRISKKRATACTPEAAKIEVDVQAMTDPVTKQKTYLVTDGYDPNLTDDLHKCSDSAPFVNDVTIKKTGGGTYEIRVSVTQSTHQLQAIDITAGGNAIGTITVSSSGTYSLSYTPTSPGNITITATAVDIALLRSTPVSATLNNNGNGNN